MRRLHSLSEIADGIAERSSPDFRVVVGITGSPGAGKSTIAEQLVDLLGPSAVVLPMDGFHLAQATLVELGRRDRMGAPDTFDVAGLLETLVRVRRGFGSSGSPVRAPGFDRVVEQPIADALTIFPEVSTVVVEGNYLLLETDGWERITPLLDLTFFVEIDPAIRLERLIARHERFGKNPQDARAWATGPDEANARLIEATAVRADYRIALG